MHNKAEQLYTVNNQYFRICATVFKKAILATGKLRDQYKLIQLCYFKFLAVGATVPSLSLRMCAGKRVT